MTPPDLLGSAAAWRQVVDSATDTAIITTDGNGRVTSWSAGAHRLLGWREDEMLGETLDRLFMQEDRDARRLEQEFADALAKGRGGGEEGFRCRRDGSRFWAVGELSPIRTGDAVTGYVKILRDRTPQREAEETLREQKRMLEILNRAGSALAQETDLQRLVQIVTDAGVELTRASFGAFFYNVLDAAGESYMLYTLAGAPLEAFSKFPMPRNTKVFAPTFGGEGIVRSDDITADPRYGHNAPHRGMPEGHLPVRSYLAVPVISRSGEVIGGLFFGHDEPGRFGERSESGLSGLAAEAAVAIDNVRLAQVWQSEIEERRRAETALMELNATLEQQVAERTEALRRNAEVLRQSQKMEALGQLTGGVAHDFNNLLQIVVGNLEALRRRLPADAEAWLRSVNAAMTGARRGAALTQRLLAFARRQPLDPRPIDLNVLVSGMSELMHRTLGELVEVETALEPEPWRVEVDGNELEAAILNLAVNARDAMADGGRLVIETANVLIDEAYLQRHGDVQPGQYVVISVSDTGTGMDARTAEQAFEPFFTTKPVGKGTGLGLSQVYGFVRQSGGHVTIYSELGHGTTVNVYLPRIADGALAAEPAAGEAQPATSRHGDVVLVVEDDEGVRQHSVEALKELGYAVLEAADGPTALKLLAQTPHVDLLFTDVVLPGGLTGAQVAAQARAIRPALKVLFTTGYARNAITHQGRLDKGVHLITKPYTYAQLALKVREVLEAG